MDTVRYRYISFLKVQVPKWRILILFHELPLQSLTDTFNRTPHLVRRANFDVHQAGRENQPTNQIILKTAVGMEEIAQVVGAEGLRKNRRRTRSGPSRFFQRPAAQQVTQDRHEQLPLLGLLVRSRATP